MSFSGHWMMDRHQLNLASMAAFLQMRNPQLLQRVVGDKLGVDLGPISVEDRAPTDALVRGSMAYRRDDVAVIRVYGPLSHRNNPYTYSYEEFERDLELAKSDEFVGAVLEIDSPGGQCSNLDEAAKRIREFSKHKPIEAMINGIGCSAAFWLASAADKAWASRTSMVGSVGSVISYWEMDGILSKWGARKIEITASQSPNKRLDPESEEGQAELQAIVDDAGQMFVEALAEYKDISAEQVLAQFGQGLVFSATDALSRGMIDGISTFERVLAGVAARSNDENLGGRAAAVSTSKEHSTMPNKQAAVDSPQPSLDERVTALQSSDPELVNAIRAEATNDQQSLIDKATAKERDRIAGIQALAEPGCENLIAEMVADGKTSPAEAAHRILTSDEYKKGKTLSALQSDDQLAQGAEPAPSAAKPSGNKVEQTPEGWTAEWEANAELQEQFVEASDYVAYKKREAKS